MSVSITNFDSSNITFGEPRSLEKGPGGKCKFVPVLYEGKRLRVITPKCFCWGIQRDTLNSNKESCKLPLVMNSVEQEHTEEQKQFVNVLDEVVKKCKGYCLSTKRTKGVDKLGSSVFQKEKDSVPTLYTKVRYNEDKKMFFTRFSKMKVKKGENKVIEPLSVENERCEAKAVVTIESIYISATHTTLQVKVDEVVMDFERAMESSLLDTVVEDDKDVAEDEW